MAAKSQLYKFAGMTANGSSPVRDVSDIETAGSTFMLFGSWVAVVALEASVDGSNWTVVRDFSGTDISGLNAVLCRNIGGRHSQLRITVTSYSSGTVQAAIISKQV